MTKGPQKKVVSQAVVVLSILLLVGLGVVPASAQRGASRTRSSSSASKGSQASSAAPSSTVSRGGSAQQTRQVKSGDSSHGGGHHGGRGGHHGHSSLSFRFGYGYYPYYYWPHSYYGFYWGPYYMPAYGGYGRTHYVDRYMGALDLNVKPKKAQVFIDGEYVGLVKSFDGYPGFLWLEKGTYEISFYLPGYQTLTRSFSVYPGSVVGVKERLEVGEAVLPEKPQKPRQRRADRPAAHWRDRDYNRDREYDRGRYDERDRQGRYREQRPDADEEKGRDVRGEPGRVRLTISPEDATVYLDGRLLGSGKELGGLRAGLIVEPGNHLLEVVRPGFESRRLEFQVEEGEEVVLSVQLTPGPTPA